MVIKKRGIIIAALVSLFSFITVAYISCTRPVDTGHKCNGFICENGGYCYIDSTTQKPRCVCPIGFEGSDCATPSVNKYIGTWDLTQKIIKSDSVVGPNDSISHYVVTLVQSPTPTTFIINNLAGNPFYSQIICTLDSMNSYHFFIDTVSDFHMLYDDYRILVGSGNISSNDSLITATMAIRHLQPSLNWNNETLNIYMTQHKY